MNKLHLKYSGGFYFPTWQLKVKHLYRIVFNKPMGVLVDVNDEDIIELSGIQIKKKYEKP